MELTKKNLKTHENFLRENVFFTKNKWPHFDLLFSDIKNYSKKLPIKKTVVSLERNRLYGGISLFGPFFRQKFIAVDCYSDTLYKRGAYNKHLVKNKKVIKVYKNFTFHYKKIKLSRNSADLVLIPNLIHHIEDLQLIFKQIKKILKNRGKIYIFEPLIRELHQEPEDFGRFTPHGLKNTLKKFGFKNFKVKYCGGPFTASAYCWDQAIQYLPKKIRKKNAKWLKKMSHLIKLDSKYKKNLLRKNTSFPMSFSIEAQK